jgi:3-dehydroquinate synthase
MTFQNFKFNHSSTLISFNFSFQKINSFFDKENTIIITDKSIFNLYHKKFKGYQTIIIKPGESSKNQQTVNWIIDELISLKADRKTRIIGVGGGTITDITGFVASIYMRGIPFAFVPTTLLGMVDAAIGGKNGINVGIYKNTIGVTNQPSHILYDWTFLKTLPEKEWQNGFAEIIKHACIKNASMFSLLQKNNLKYYQHNKTELASLIERNVKIKLKVVLSDEFEKSERKLLNFGHTFGHAIENQYKIPHGHAVSIGMIYAASISANICNFKKSKDISDLLSNYGLPTKLKIDKTKILDAISMDKKKNGDKINFILLNKIGKGIIHNLPLKELSKFLYPEIISK